MGLTAFNRIRREKAAAMNKTASKPVEPKVEEKKVEPKVEEKKAEVVEEPKEEVKEAPKPHAVGKKATK